MQPVVQQLELLSDERFLEMYESLSQNGFGPLDAEVAKALKFRPQAIRKLPMPQRAKRARALIRQKHNAELAYELLGGYLMATSKDVVTEFLDLTGVPHEEGMIERLDENTPDLGRLHDAVKALDEKHPPENVTIYLSLCAQQWPLVPELEALWRKRSGAAVDAK
jgi:uncharacterized protein (UPF0297 family)